MAALLQKVIKKKNTSCISIFREEMDDFFNGFERLKNKEKEIAKVYIAAM